MDETVFSISPQLTLPQTAQSEPDLASATTKEAARAVAQEFEAMFIAQMLQPVFASLETDGLTGGGSAEAAFRPMLVDEYAKAFAEGGGLGLSDEIYAEILKLQGLE